MEYVSGNLFIRDMGSLTNRHPKGWVMDGHSHNFHHNTLIVAGSYRCIRRKPIVDAAGKPQTDANGQPLLMQVDDVVRSAPAILPIEADCWHSFECLEDGGILLCVYSHRDPQSHEVVQMPNGWSQAYV